MSKVRFLNNSGQGFATEHEIVDGETTLVQFLSDQLGKDFDPEAYTIRVNREPASSDMVLHNDDKITATAKRIKGAC